MDEINKELIKQNVGIRMDNIDEPVGCLLWMDDVALIAENPTILQKMLDVTNDIACRYHIEFGTEKSKVIKVGRKKDKIPIHLGDKILEYCETYKYLGETINNKMSLTQQITGTKQKTEAAYQTILNIMGNKQFQEIEMQTAWKLLETCIQPIITYGGETWNPNKKEEKEINRIQENIIMRILMVPQSTPIESLYMETGLMDITTIIYKNRMGMEKRLMNKKESITTRIMLNGTKGGWKDTTEKIKDKLTQDNPNKPTEIHKKDILKHFQKKINEQAKQKTKLDAILKYSNWQPGQRPEYMKKLTRVDVSTLFKARTRMLDIKNNYRGKYTDLKCRWCDEERETQEHIMEECPGIHKDEELKIPVEKLFLTNLEELKQQINKLKKIIQVITCSSPSEGLSDPATRMDT
jgi:hypothetical protein